MLLVYSTDKSDVLLKNILANLFFSFNHSAHIHILIKLNFGKDLNMAKNVLRSRFLQF